MYLSVLELIEKELNGATTFNTMTKMQHSVDLLNLYECHLFTIVLIATMLSVIVLSVIMQSVTTFSVILINVTKMMTP